MIKIFDSVRELAEAARYTANHVPGGAWTGGETHAQSIAHAMTGDMRMVPTAEKLIAKLETQIELPSREFMPSVEGAYPIVADYLTGDPMCMRRRGDVMNERAPISIFVCLTSSSAVSTHDLMRRGTTILALLLALSQSHPMQLIAFSMLHGSADGESIVGARINTTPLDIATAAYALAHPGMCRNILYGYQTRVYNSNGSWPTAYHYDGRNGGYFGSLIRRLGGDENSLFIPPIEMHDLLVSNPIEWVNNQVKRFTKAQEV